MPTFVHTADVHLDTPFTARFTPEQAALRRKEVMQTFQRIADAAAGADFFFVAGDLFDGRYVASETVAFLKRCFAEMPDTQVFLATGNHDPLTPESVYATEDWGANVHIFGTEMEYVDVPALKTRVHGRSFAHQHETESLLEPPELAEGWCNILVLHGEVVARDGESAYNPIEKPGLEQSGVVYAALGHIHQYSGLQRVGGSYYAYPGIPEGRGFDEEGARGYLTGEILPDAVHAEWKPICRREFRCLKLDVSDCADSLAVLARIEAAIQAEGAEKIYRILLTGTAETGIIQPEFFMEQLKDAAFGLELRDETQPGYVAEELAKEPSLRGAFASEMLKRMGEASEDAQALYRLAMTIGLDAIERGTQK